MKKEKKELFLKTFKVGDCITCQSWLDNEVYIDYVIILSISKNSFNGADNSGGGSSDYVFDEEIWIPYTGEIKEKPIPLTNMQKATVLFISADNKEIVMELEVNKDGGINMQLDKGECGQEDYEGLNLGVCNLVLKALTKEG
jgi:hypothetical protein